MLLFSTLGIMYYRKGKREDDLLTIIWIKSYFLWLFCCSVCLSNHCWAVFKCHSSFTTLSVNGVIPY
ncbi:hypothetical protein [uncultured Gammaproteobacteria bacterium]|nr:hypothetical protein [uncultured Gammaproteobacteria bacterium]CAC9607021.1 hypothetical protein [uncultured Gammaproteobacteria bacterium]